MVMRYVGGALVLWLHYVIINSKMASFKGYYVLKVEVTSETEWMLLQDFMANATEEVDVWHLPEMDGDSLHVLLRPSEHQAWTDFCHRESLQCSVIIHDLDSLIENELHSSHIPGTHRGRYTRGTDTTRDELLYRLAGTFPTFEQIERWLKDLNDTESIVNLVDIGKSYENRSLYVLEITGSHEPGRVPAMWVDMGIHSREWIAHTSGIHVISKLIEGYYQNTLVRPLVENMMWYIMPVVNPDGYVYSHTDYRFWRKNRSPPPDGVRDGYKNTTCLGVDLNRNWDFHWAERDVSTNSCSVVYPGHEANSELETKAMARYVLDRSENIHGYVTIHSYGQMFLSRWAFVNDTPWDHQELIELAKKTAESITDVHGAYYTHGISPRILYPYSGGSPDWARGVAQIKYSYSVELRDRGEYGFLLPPSYIRPVGEEIFKGLLVVGSQALKYGHNITTTTSTTTTTTSTTDVDVIDDVTIFQTSSAVNRFLIGSNYYLNVTFMTILFYLAAS